MTFQRNPSKEYPWFVFNGEDFYYYKTEDDALESSKEEALGFLLDDGWSEEVTNVMVGKVTATAVQVERVERPDESCVDEQGYDDEGRNWSEFNYYCDYKCLPIT
ncbi:hypothetical protein [Aliivibrio wodanis]|uniref:hypothetical protein n=1 Tax=Aliivibrio wodanis TaxID=80852 RepID=UPI00406C0A4C